MLDGATFRIYLEVGIVGKTDGARFWMAQMRNWKQSVSTVKAVIKFAMATEKLTHTPESETGVGSRAKEINGRTRSREPANVIIID